MKKKRILFFFAAAMVLCLVGCQSHELKAGRAEQAIDEPPQITTAIPEQTGLTNGVTEIFETDLPETISEINVDIETIPEVFEFDKDSHYTLDELFENMSDEELFEINELNLIVDTSPNEKTMGLFKNLTELYLYAENDIDISSLKKLDSLKKIIIYGGMGSQVEGLEALTEIDSLELINIYGVTNNMIDLSIFGDMPNLNTLICQHCVYVSMTDASSFKSLNNLVIMETACGNIQMIGLLTRLESLTIANTYIEDLSWINNLTNLKKLNFNGTSYGKFCNVDNLKNLEYLDICPYDYDFPDGVKVEVSQMIQITSLKEFHAAKKDFSNDDITEIESKLPNCNIFLYPLNN